MTGSQPLAIGREGVRETLFGRRGIVKVVHASLPLGMAASLGSTAEGAPLGRACLLMLLAIGCWSQSATLANDLTDSAEDAAAGKRRWIRMLPRSIGWAVVAAMVAAGALVTTAAGHWSVPAAYGGAVLLGIAYSVRPVRLKDRSLGGPLAYAGASAVAYAVLPWTWLRPGLAVPAVLVPAVFLDKWVNLHFHQVIDYEADRTTGAGTHAVAVGHGRARRLLRRLAWLTAFWLVGTAAFVALALPAWRTAAASTAGLVVLLAGRYVHRVRARGEAASDLVRELPPIYLALTLALFRALPVLVFARLAVMEPSAWGPFAVVVILVGLDAWYAVGYRYE
ncbi:MAG: hypothetical protein GXY85_05315 [Candidatus Brocadiaceae bacterium]|nr:hypothetical protein [Candidatus Brocadiaceae bacterium]